VSAGHRHRQGPPHLRWRSADRWPAAFAEKRITMHFSSVPAPGRLERWATAWLAQSCRPPWAVPAAQVTEAVRAALQPAAPSPISPSRTRPLEETCKSFSTASPPTGARGLHSRRPGGEGAAGRAARAAGVSGAATGGLLPICLLSAPKMVVWLLTMTCSGNDGVVDDGWPRPGPVGRFGQRESWHTTWACCSCVSSRAPGWCGVDPWRFARHVGVAPSATNPSPVGATVRLQLAAVPLRRSCLTLGSGPLLGRRRTSAVARASAPGGCSRGDCRGVDPLVLVMAIIGTLAAYVGKCAPISSDVWLGAGGPCPASWYLWNCCRPGLSQADAICPSATF